MTTTFVPGAGGGGTQYPDGTTQATPTGTAALAKNPSNVLKTLAVDASGNLNVNLAAGSISGGNAAASPTGAAVPASADYTGFNSGGNLVGVSSANPLPVSLANTGANATALKVDGSAVTQPIAVAALPLPSGAATSAKQPALGTAGAASADVISVQGVASMTALKVDGSAVTQPVSGSVSVSNFPATQPVSGTVTANQGTANAAPWNENIAQVGGTAAAATAKGTQATNGIGVQDLKDSGRSARIIFLDSFAVAATAETLMTMSYSSDNATVTTGTSYSVTSAKRLRIQSINVGLHTITGNTTAVNVIIRLRVNNGGAALVSSPIQMVIPVQGIATANQAGIPVDITIPDGWEFVAGAGIGVTVACSGFVTTTAAPKVDISIVGYEY